MTAVTHEGSRVWQDWLGGLSGVGVLHLRCDSCLRGKVPRRIVTDLYHDRRPSLDHLDVVGDDRCDPVLMGPGLVLLIEVGSYLQVPFVVLIPDKHAKVHDAIGVVLAANQVMGVVLSRAKNLDGRRAIEPPLVVPMKGIGLDGDGSEGCTRLSASTLQSVVFFTIPP